jgi:hypothetical protein
VPPVVEQLVRGVQLAATHTCLVASQVWPDGQAPQSSDPSQPLPMTPQYWPPANVQASFVQFGLPQTPVTLAPQAVPVGQLEPQLRPPPQPLPIVPQYVTPEAVQVVLGVQLADTQTCWALQVEPAGQAPQSSDPSQPSPTTPQYWPPVKVQETFVQLGLPHTLATLAPQAVPAGQLEPQLTAPPQPSPIVPQ